MRAIARATSAPRRAVDRGADLRLAGDPTPKRLRAGVLELERRENGREVDEGSRRGGDGEPAAVGGCLAIERRRAMQLETRTRFTVSPDHRKRHLGRGVRRLDDPHSSPA